MSNSIKENLSEIKEKPKKIRYIVKTLLFKSFPKKILFIVWFILLIYYPIWNPIYLDESDLIHLSDYNKALIDMIFSCMQLTLLLFTLLHTILSKIMKLTVAFLFFLCLSGVGSVYIYIYIPFSTIIIPLVGIGAYILQRLLLVGDIGPLISKLAKPFHLGQKKVRGFGFIVIEPIVIILGIFFLQIYVIPEWIGSTAGYSYQFWTWATASFSIVVFFLYIIIPKGNHPFYRDVKNRFIFILPVVQIFVVYLVLRSFLSNILPESSTVPNIMDILLFLILATWDLLGEIRGKLKRGSDIQPEKIYTSILWTYTITAFIAFNEELGLEEFSELISLIFIGLGIIVLLSKLGKKLAVKYQIQNYSLGRMLSNQLNDGQGNKLKE
jgi:hypothetical protein